MALNENAMSPADFAAMAGNGNEWSSWIILFLIFAMFGWGGFGGVNKGQTAAGVADNYVLASDFANIQRQIDSAADGLRQQSVQISNGLCDGFYTQAQLVNGTNMNIANGFAQAELSRANLAATNIAAVNSLGTQLQQCCCDNRSAIADVNFNIANQANGIQRSVESGLAQLNYNSATNACAINNNIANAARDITENANGNTRAILDAINSNKVDSMREKISEQQAQIQALNLAASQQAQNAYLIQQLRGGCCYNCT